MTVVNPKSISGINSITTGSGSDNLLTIHTSDANSTERVRINSSGDVIVGSGITLSQDGDIFTTGITTFTNDVKINVDSKKILLGAGADLEFFHNGTNSHLRTQTGNLIIDNNSGGTVNIRPKIGEEGVVCTTDGSTALYHDGTKKFETSSTGASVSGNLDLSADNYKLRLGGGNDIELYTDGSNSFLNNENGNWYIHGSTGSNGQEILIRPRQGEQSIRAIADGAVELYHNNVKKIETATEGVVIPSGGGNCLRVFGQNTAHATSALIIGQNSTTVSQLRAYGPDASTNGTIELRSSRSDGSSSVNLIYNGNLQFASGYGIDFSNAADQASGESSTEEILNDYEAGSFEPSIQGSGGSGMSFSGGSYNGGYYVRVGRIVHVSMNIRGTFTLGSGSGSVIITNLPFTAGNTNELGGTSGNSTYAAFSTPYHTGLSAQSTSFIISGGMVVPNTTNINIYQQQVGAANNPTVAVNTLSTSSDGINIHMSGSYLVT